MKYLEYRENQKHGTIAFPMAFYHITPSHPRYEMSYHWHQECELVRVLQGELNLHINNEHIKAKAGDIMYISGGELHGGTPSGAPAESASGCIYECAVYYLEELTRGNSACEKLLRELAGGAFKIQRIFNQAQPEIKKIVWQLFETLCEKKAGYELAVTGQILCFYAFILKENYGTKAFEMEEKDKRRIRQLKEALRLIESSYHTDLSLKQLAQAAQMSEKYFCRVFKAMTHKTPFDYLNYYRIERACLELAATDHSITEIAFNCGFNELSYFISVFKKYKGTTPKKYLAESNEKSKLRK